MKPIIIYTYDYNPAIGGVKVMHKLCDMLNANGCESYLMPIEIRENFYTCSDYNTPIITQEILDNIEDAIVIYPEGIKGNPLNCKNVIRWILGPARQEDIDTYSKSDIIYWYMDYYYDNQLGQKDNILQITEFHEDIFKNINHERKGTCYTIRKGKVNTPMHPEDSFFIPFTAAGDLVGLANVFNKSEKFYCYDNYTFLYVQAAMCGCISVVIPDGIKTKEEWRSGWDLNKYGIAYGEDDIPRAIETLPLLYKEIERIKLEMNKEVIKFIDHCKEIF